MQLEAAKKGDLNQDTATRKADLEGKLRDLVQSLVEKIQKKHESLIDKQQQLAQDQMALKTKYTPIFEQMEGIL
jgi:gas vesicle protein